MKKYFDVNEKKGRYFSPSAQKIESVGFVHNKAIHTRTKRKIILQGMDKNVQCFVQLIITIFCQIMQRDPKFFTDN
jgi:hypothetical protein